MYFLYKNRRTGELFTSPLHAYPFLGQGEAATFVSVLLASNKPSLEQSFPPHGNVRLYRELMSEHAHGCDIADLIGTIDEPINPLPSHDDE